MVISHIPGDVKLRRCGYCLVKVSIQDVLEEEGMSDLKALIVFQLVLVVCNCCSEEAGQTVSYTSSSDGYWHTGQFSKAGTIPCWFIETRMFCCHEKIVFCILTAISTRPCSTVKEVILKIS